MPELEKAAPYRPKILVLASTYPRWHGDHEPGFVHELNRRLADEFDVHVVCPHAPGAASHEVMDGVSIHRFRYAPEAFETLVQDGGILANLNRSRWKWFLVPFFFIGLMVACSRCVKQIGPHAIHAHWIVPQGLAIALLSVFSRSFPPFLITSHGGDLFGLRGRIFQSLKRWVMRRASAFTVVSQPMVDTAIKLGADPERTSVIPMGVDFSSRFSVDREKQRVAGQILFVGRLVEKKGVKYLNRGAAGDSRSSAECTLGGRRGWPGVGGAYFSGVRTGFERLRRVSRAIAAGQPCLICTSVLRYSSPPSSMPIRATRRAWGW